MGATRTPAGVHRRDQARHVSDLQHESNRTFLDPLEAMESRILVDGKAQSLIARPFVFIGRGDDRFDDRHALLACPRDRFSEEIAPAAKVTSMGHAVERTRARQDAGCLCEA